MFDSTLLGAVRSGAEARCWATVTVVDKRQRALGSGQRTFEWCGDLPPGQPVERCGAAGLCLQVQATATREWSSNSLLALRLHLR